MMNITKDIRLLKRNINTYDTSTNITLCDWTLLLLCDDLSSRRFLEIYKNIYLF